VKASKDADERAWRIYGRVYCLEIKTAHGGRVSEVQRVVHERLCRAGAEVAVVFGLEETLAQLTAWGILVGRSQ
jgi:hypothetical protein